MFFLASIALTSVLSISQIVVNSAPISLNFTFPPLVPQACTLPLFSGDCIPLNGTACTNTPGVQSLVLNRDADCDTFTVPDCQGSSVKKFSDTSLHLEGQGIQSVQCVEKPGTENGFVAGSAEAIAQEAADEDASEGFVPAPPANCTEEPVPLPPEEIASDEADGFEPSGPITCTFD